MTSVSPTSRMHVARRAYRAHNTSSTLFRTIFGGLNGRHLLAAQKYLSEQQGRLPL